MTALATKPRLHPVPQTQVAAATSADFAGLKVLLVEDDPVALEELQDVIDIEGWTPVTAHNVETAIESLREDQDIRIVVTDVHFVDPDGDVSNGIQLVSRAKAWFSDRPLSFIVLSGDPDAMASSAQEGAFDFLSKPLRPQTLVAAIHKALTGSESLHGPSYVKNILIDRVKERTNAMFGIKKPGSAS